MCGDEIRLPEFSGLRIVEGDLRSVARPVRQKGRDWGLRELQPIGAIDAAAPERAIGIGHVDDPFSVAGEVDFTGRDASQEWSELVRLAVIADQLAARHEAVGKELLAIRARDGKGK